MIKLSAEQMARMDELYFYGKLSRFAASRCRNPKLTQWLSAQAPAHDAWRAVWPEVRGLNEHDCALLLIFQAVCDCEGIAAGPMNGLITQLPQREVAIKRFISERGYFAFSDFEFALPAEALKARAG